MNVSRLPFLAKARNCGNAVLPLSPMKNLSRQSLAWERRVRF